MPPHPSRTEAPHPPHPTHTPSPCHPPTHTDLTEPAAALVHQVLQAAGRAHQQLDALLEGLHLWRLGHAAVHAQAPAAGSGQRAALGRRAKGRASARLIGGQPGARPAAPRRSDGRRTACPPAALPATRAPPSNACTVRAARAAAWAAAPAAALAARLLQHLGDLDGQFAGGRHREREWPLASDHALQGEAPADAGQRAATQTDGSPRAAPAARGRGCRQRLRAALRAQQRRYPPQPHSGRPGCPPRGRAPPPPVPGARQRQAAAAAGPLPHPLHPRGAHRFALGGHVAQHGQAKGQGLARARGSDADEVAAREHDGPALALDGGRLLEGARRVQHAGGQAGLRGPGGQGVKEVIPPASPSGSSRLPGSCSTSSRAAVQPCSRAAVQPCSRAAVQPGSWAAVQPCSRQLGSRAAGQLGSWPARTCANVRSGLMLQPSTVVWRSSHSCCTSAALMAATSGCSLYSTLRMGLPLAASSLLPTAALACFSGAPPEGAAGAAAAAPPSPSAFCFLLFFCFFPAVSAAAGQGRG
jgi:hypothetical protein